MKCQYCNERIATQVCSGCHENGCHACIDKHDHATVPLPVGVVSKDQPGYATAKRRWSKAGAPPALGERVVVRMNGLGEGVVHGYGLSEGEESRQYLYVSVKLSAPPEWYIKQCGGNPPANIFGVELA